MFPKTSLTALGRARSSDPADHAKAWQHLAAVYHRPVYLHLRLKWRKSSEEAEDLTQHFFVHALERDLLASYEPARGRFRSFIRVCVDRLVMNEHEARLAQKRGGGHRPVEIDVSDLEATLRDLSHQDPDRIFEIEWAKSVLSASVERLRQRLEEEGRSHQFDAFRRYDLAEDPPTYAEIAQAMGIAVTDVTNYLFAARKRFRAIALEVLGELTTTDEELEAEARELFGVT